MRKSTQKLFRQLEDRKRAITFPAAIDPYGVLFPKWPSTYAPNTLANFADRLRIPHTILIEQFASAGIVGLTANHIISQGHKVTLLEYLRAKHRSPVQTIYQETSPLEQQLIVVQDITHELLKELSVRPNLIFQLQPRKFEELVARLLEDIGCEITLTKRTRDGGYDLFGKMKSGPSNIVFLAECKRYGPQNKVGVEIVRGLYGVLEMHKANLGLVITSSSFTKDAHAEKLRMGPRIDLKEYDDLCSWLAPYRKD